MASETYEVLYSTKYNHGNILFPIDVCKELLKRFPPGTKIGDHLFPEDHFKYYIANDDTPPDKLFAYFRIARYEDFCEGFRKVYVLRCTSLSTDEIDLDIITDGNKYYSISQYSMRNTWRISPEVIQCVKEKGYIGKEIDGGSLQIARIPVGYSVGIHQFAGEESIYPKCPTFEIISDLLEIIKNGSKDSVHCLTQKLLDGTRLFDIIYPKVEGDLI